MKKHALLPVALVVLLSCIDQSEEQTLPLPVENPWFMSGESALNLALSKQIENRSGSAKNIILMIGDGMSLATVTAARIYAGQANGNTGEEYVLSFETFPWTGLAKTYNTNQQTPDSAGTMTAMLSGIKTKAGFIAMDDRGPRRDCEGNRGGEVTSLLELAEVAGRATGLVTNTRITHATPAAAYAKSPEREWERDDIVGAEALAQGCRDIAAQLIEFSHGDGIDLVFGGGRLAFLPESTEGVEGKQGRRTDGRNLFQEWLQRYPAGQLVQSQAGFEQLDLDSNGPILGIFNPSHMRYAPDRPKDVLGEPDLASMTVSAIRKLEQNDDGFFLIVEGGRIDHAHHAGNAAVALMETVEFADAVAVADEMTDDRDTLIIVTADHSHTLVAGGYPTRGNPILGKVIENDLNGRAKSELAVDADGLPYTTLGYLNGPGFAEFGSDSTNPDVRYREPPDPGRKDLTTVDTQDVGYHQEAIVPMADETHSPVDVPVYAKGPGSHLLSGTIEQHLIFHVMRHVGGY